MLVHYDVGVDMLVNGQDARRRAEEAEAGSASLQRRAEAAEKEVIPYPARNTRSGDIFPCRNSRSRAEAAEKEACLALL